MTPYHTSSLGSLSKSTAARTKATVFSLLRVLDHLGKPYFLISLPKIRQLAVCLVALVFLANARSWPLAWHFKSLKHVVACYLSNRVSMARVYLSTPTRKQKANDQWWESYALKCGCVGANPMEFRTYFKDWVSIDDGDFNGHLSNSSYAKVLDAVRYQTAVEAFPILFRAGGWIPLAGMQFRFLREIQTLNSYEVWTSILTWEDKWVYILHKFTSSTKPKPGEETINGRPVHTVSISQICFKIGRITVPAALVLAVCGYTARPTPLPPASPSAHASSPRPHSDLKGEGGVLWTEGGRGPQWASTDEWERVKDMMNYGRDGHPKKLRQYLCGGWREEKEKALAAFAAAKVASDAYAGDDKPNAVQAQKRGSEGNRNGVDGLVWWERVFSDLEERRVANLESLRTLEAKTFS